MNRKQRRKLEKTGEAPPADFTEALRLYGQRQFEEADALLVRALKRRPDHADSFHLRGIIAQTRGAFAEAIALLRKAVAIDEAHPHYRSNLGLAFLKSGDSAAAVGAFEAALSLAPGHAEIQSNLAKALAATGDVAAALENYAQALALKPSLTVARCDWAALLYASGRPVEAIAQYRKALATDPSLPLAHHNLGKILYEQGDLAGAEKHLREGLSRDPDDRLGARLLLAGIGKEALPARASAAFLRDLYDRRAADWDGIPTYYAHHLVAAALEKQTSRRDLDILDAGCGTGLVGTLVRRLARRLDGVDLSQEMLDRAAAKGIYDSLHCAELTTWLGQNEAAYDAVASAATLIHFGDLGPVFRAAHRALRPGGALVFSALPPTASEDDDRVTAGSHALALGGCFLHGRSYIRNRATEAGFTVETMDEEIHERSGGLAQPGLVVVMRKSARPLAVIAQA